MFFLLTYTSCTGVFGAQTKQYAIPGKLPNGLRPQDHVKFSVNGHGIAQDESYRNHSNGNIHNQSPRIIPKKQENHPNHNTSVSTEVHPVPQEVNHAVVKNAVIHQVVPNTAPVTVVSQTANHKVVDSVKQHAAKNVVSQPLVPQTSQHATVNNVAIGYHAQEEHRRTGHRLRNDPHPRGTIRTNEDSMKNNKLEWFGFPRYGDSLPQWSDVNKSTGILNRECDLPNAFQQCGYQYPCINNLCRRCRRNKECPDKYKCMPNPVVSWDPSDGNVCVPRDLLGQWGWGDIVATVLITFAAMLCAIAGLGGGGVYVPLMLLLLGLSPREAVPLSQVLIVGGAIVNVMMFMGDSHPKYRDLPRIDYDVVMMLNPSLACGVTLGVICHIISPSWLIVLLLFCTLVIAFHKTLRTGFSSWRIESQLFAASKDGAGHIGTNCIDGGESGGGSGVPPNPLTPMSTRMERKISWEGGTYFSNYKKLLHQNRFPMIMIILCWLSFCVMNIWDPSKCSGPYWLNLIGQVLIALAFTIYGSYHTTQDKGRDLDWNDRNMWLYPFFATLSGFCGGFLGIGGGMIMGPLLLELGMAPEVNQATTATFVFLSASLASLQYFLLGQEMPQYVLWYATWVIVATLIGQIAIDYLLSKQHRPSLIIFAIAAVLGVSMVMMTVVGVLDVIADVRNNAHMGFAPHLLCR